MVDTQLHFARDTFTLVCRLSTLMLVNTCHRIKMKAVTKIPRMLLTLMMTTAEGSAGSSATTMMAPAIRVPAMATTASITASLSNTNKTTQQSLKL